MTPEGSTPETSDTASTQLRPAVARPTAAAPSPDSPPSKVSKQAHSVHLKGLRAFYGSSEQVKGIDLDFEANKVTAIIGPSGCGKSTMVRCINRMHEEIPGARAEGRVMLDDIDIYGPSVDIVAVRRAIGMIFQKPNPFPTMSIFDNVASGLRLSGAGRGNLHDKVEKALRGAGLWEEVKDRLDQPGVGLSGGQQQRLCIARSLAVDRRSS
jgi:phosphate transport system ATP-binding protein